MPLRAMPIALLLLSLVAIAPARAEDEKLLTLAATSDTERIAAGTAFDVTLAVTLAEGWHINTTEPELDYLIPSKVVVEAPVVLGEVTWPKPATMEVAFLKKTISMFEGELTIGVEVSFAADTEPGLVPLEGYLRYQACKGKVCKRPAKARFSLPLMVTAAE